MTREELLKELEEVRKRLETLPADTQAYRVGKIIEANILHSLDITGDENARS